MNIYIENGFLGLLIIKILERILSIEQFIAYNTQCPDVNTFVIRLTQNLFRRLKDFCSCTGLTLLVGMDGGAKITDLGLIL